MALEKSFDWSFSINRLRNGPLETFVDDFLDSLQKSGFSYYSIQKHLGYLFHFANYLNVLSPSPRIVITTKDVKRFYKEYEVSCRHRSSVKNHLRNVSYSVNRFIKYLDKRGFFEHQQAPNPFQNLLKAYLDWMYGHQHVAISTLKIREHSISQFLCWLGSNGTTEKVAELKADKIEEFFLAYVQRKQIGRAARRSMQSALRTFLRFCFQKNYIDQPLDQAVPALRSYKLSTTPRGLSESQAQTVLNSIDRSSFVGIRDYAILQILNTYGVRGGQVRALRINDIHWKKNQIHFRALKNGKDVLLPLTTDVGQSLIEYLYKARPPCMFPEIFLTSRAPYHPFEYSNALSAIVDRRIRNAGIKIHSQGSHAFRHGLATRLINNGYSLKDIADLLGHRHLSSTFIYTKVDFNTLKQVALEWPMEEKL